MASPKHIQDAEERVSDYLDSLPDFSKKICNRLREIILKSDPKIIEDWKLGPNYYLDGMICGFAGFQKHVNFVFFKGALLKDTRKLLLDSGSLNNRHFRFTNVKEINEDVLLEYIIEATDNNKSGKVVKPPVLALTRDVKKEFKKAGVLTYFESLTYSHKKQYTEWIESAKKDETRIRRISNAIVMLGKKEKINFISKK